MDELKHLVEAILFAAARKLELEEIAKLCKHPEQEVLEVLMNWRKELSSSSGPIMLVQDGSAWKLSVREKYVHVVKKVVTKTELPKSILETLAIVAYKAPVLQSKVIKLRTNKAYEHLKELEESDFISREKSGRTMLIKLSPKFFEYFDISRDKLKQKFGSADEVEKAIEAKEKEIEQNEEQQRKDTGELLGKAEIDLESYPAVVVDTEPSSVEEYKEEFDGLEVFDVAKPHHKVRHKKKSKKHHEKAVPVEEPAELAEGTSDESAVSEEVEEAPIESRGVVEDETVVEKPKPEIVKSKVKPKAEKPEEMSEKPLELSREQKLASEVAEKTRHAKSKSFEEGKGLFPKGIPPEVEKKIEERIQSLLSGEEPETKPDEQSEEE